MSDVFTLFPTEFGESLVENFRSALWLAVGRRRAALVLPLTPTESLWAVAT